MINDLNNNKSLLNIEEAAKIIGVKKHVLRHWEARLKELGSDALNITKGRSNNSNENKPRRYYRDEDIKLLLTIKYLLYDKKFTMKGVVEEIKYKSNNNFLDKKIQSLKKISYNLREIVKNIN